MQMKIRITGTKEECLTFAEDLEMYYEVRNISEFYPNTRKNIKSKEGRIYIEAILKVYDPKNKTSITI